MLRLTGFAIALFVSAALGLSNRPEIEASDGFQPQPNSDRDAGVLQNPAAESLVSADKGKPKKPKPEDPKNLPPGWFSNYDQALARARATGQPLLVLFH